MPLRPGKYRIIVREPKAFGRFLSMVVRVYRADPSDHAVGRRVAHQISKAASSPLRRDRQRAIFDEASFIEQVSQIFTRAPLVGTAATLHRIWPVFIQPKRVTGLYLGKIRPNEFRIDHLLSRVMFTDFVRW